MTKWDIVAFYVFAPVEAPREAARHLGVVAGAAGLRGTTIVASEGINGTMAGGRAELESYLAVMRALAGPGGWEVKWSGADAAPFRRLKVRVKAEIVTMGEPGIAAASRVGRYVAPEAWNDLVAAPDVAVIDTRNGYETDIGRFRGAILPGTDSFREFPDWWRANAARFEGKRVAMYCTGGIRCEKATRFLIGEGVSEVCHLRGGILRYLEAVPEAQSLWDGACFVFDGRVAVGHGMRETGHAMCHACGRAVSPAECAATDYRPGVQCSACRDEYSDADRERFAMRQRQFDRVRATSGG